MKSDNAIRNGTSIFVGIIVSIAAFARGALLLPLLLVACSVWGLYVLHHLRGSLPAVPKKKAKAPRRTKFVVPDIEDGPLSDILLLHVNQRTLYGLSNAVTRHSQDVESYDRASELESIGYSILTMPPRQWSRINRAAA